MRAIPAPFNIINLFVLYRSLMQNKFVNSPLQDQLQLELRDQMAPFCEDSREQQKQFCLGCTLSEVEVLFGRNGDYWLFVFQQLRQQQ
jgi:hypothetical protein